MATQNQNGVSFAAFPLNDGMPNDMLSYVIRGLEKELGVKKDDRFEVDDVTKENLMVKASELQKRAKATPSSTSSPSSDDDDDTSKKAGATTIRKQILGWRFTKWIIGAFVLVALLVAIAIVSIVALNFWPTSETSEVVSEVTDITDITDVSDVGSDQPGFTDSERSALIGNTSDLSRSDRFALIELEMLLGKDLINKAGFLEKFEALKSKADESDAEKSDKTDPDTQPTSTKDRSGSDADTAQKLKFAAEGALHTHQAAASQADLYARHGVDSKRVSQQIQVAANYAEPDARLRMAGVIAFTKASFQHGKQLPYTFTDLNHLEGQVFVSSIPTDDINQAVREAQAKGYTVFRTHQGDVYRWFERDTFKSLDEITWRTGPSGPSVTDWSGMRLRLVGLDGDMTQEVLWVSAVEDPIATFVAAESIVP